VNWASGNARDTGIEAALTQVNARAARRREPAHSPSADAQESAMVMLPFRDRIEAARELALALEQYRDARPVVLAIPRGAVPMSRLIADALGGDLDIVLVKKIGAPGHAEFAVGAVDEQGNVAVNEGARWAGATDAYVRAEAASQLAALRERAARYRGPVAPVPLAGRVAIIVDDGLATGSTMAAALKAVRRQGASKVVCAVPVASVDALAQVRPLADATVCLAAPRDFGAVGYYYRDFAPVEDAEVMAALARVPATAQSRSDATVATFATAISLGSERLDADLALPARPRGLVVFAHGSGSSRLSSRNRAVARSLNQRGLATLLFDLLTTRENAEPSARFDIPLLAERLQAAVAWARAEPRVSALPVGLFGASTGAAAALVLAARAPDQVAAVVSRGGRPDLAGFRVLGRVLAPTLLVVGGEDHDVLELNRAALQAMPEGKAQLRIVPGATHLFEEPGALEQAATLAADWFCRWLPEAAVTPESQANAVPPPPSQVHAGDVARAGRPHPPNS
jgi:predicted phosphoribosyltransferase/dienelactone hydrolase